ncbi:unnamed protein product [Mesocestoides corti]|uniref:UL134 n=1 Tax=Mesocestoides corti TaxID=53468 RepID=A0A0R3UFC1_MESCO|nr:unnamed protein product [Mesocestoides corti]
MRSVSPRVQEVMTSRRVRGGVAADDSSRHHERCVILTGREAPRVSAHQLPMAGTRRRQDGKTTGTARPHASSRTYMMLKEGTPTRTTVHAYDTADIVYYHSQRARARRPRSMRPARAFFPFYRAEDVQGVFFSGRPRMPTWAMGLQQNEKDTGGMSDV